MMWTPNYLSLILKDKGIPHSMKAEYYSPMLDGVI